jgi:hypothetical protein
MAAETTQGSKIQIGAQTGFGVPQSTLADVRSEETFTVKDPVDTMVPVNSVTGNPYDIEKSVNIQRPVMDAAVVNPLVRQAATAGQDSTIAKLFKAGGWDVAAGTDTTVGTYTSETAITATADNFDAGQGVVVELDDGSYFPALISSATAGAYTFAMGLPSASSADNAMNKCFTITPAATGEITATDLLTAKAFFKDSSGRTIQWQDCAAVSVGDLDLAIGETIKFSFTLGGSKYTMGTGQPTANTFVDGDSSVVFANPVFQFADASAAGAIAHNDEKLFGATISFAVKAEQINATGDSTAVNDMCSWMKIAEPNSVQMSIDFLYDANKITDFNGTNTSKYIAITVPSTSATEPCFSVIMPNGHQVEAPTIAADGNEYRVTAKYAGRPAGYSSTTEESDEENQTLYILIGDQSA